MAEVIANETPRDATADMEVLVFALGGEEYGVDILKVQEIRGYNQVTRIANVPDFVKGVTNLRGSIVPIIDARIKFGLENAAYDQHTVVIVLNVGERVVGVVVDSVSDVLTLTPEQIKPAPDFGVATSTEHVLGLGSVDDRMLILVDIDQMMSSRELALVEDVEAIAS
ncbi:chemotaxis protein CheW [Salinisphaera shabanensis T35B1]|jgi:purine-binding chemotaxis protein CheW|uniref:Chemotaxis protein CheW n=1 Tax=Salinisphaera shabanensis E1L3A TaxID=1033802 RepID=F7Q517_9GAMM|nr:chemotaxis protein CheW [Salinisphaera shabanensis]ERJ19045.1 Chemotaxis protein CheW [Salinisphaera shabanensis E1L3A]